MKKAAEHLDRLFDLHDDAVDELTQKGGPTDVEELKITFKKFLVIAVMGFFDKEIQRIGDNARLKGDERGLLLNFITSFVMEEEENDPELTSAFHAYLELREARNQFAHQGPGERSEKFDNWTVEDVRTKYAQAMGYLPTFKKKAVALAEKRRETSPSAP